MEFTFLKQGVNFTPARRLLYYSQRILTEARVRRFICNRLVSRIRACTDEELPDWQASSAASDASGQALAQDGYAPLDALLSTHQVADIHRFLRDKHVMEYHNNRRVFPIHAVPDGARIADHSLQDVLACPHILELANSPFLLRLAARYVGCKPTISALGLRWSFPASESGSGLQAFHRDVDDWRFIKVFVYLTEVDEGSGPHIFVRGTHLTPAPVRLRSYSDEEVARIYGKDAWITVTGGPGFGFAVDTYGIHKGLVPMHRPRLLLQIQYSLLPVYAYDYKPQPHRPDLKLDPYINRLLLE